MADVPDKHLPRLTLGGKLLIVVLTFTGLFAANFAAYNYLLKELDKTATAVDAAGRQRMLSQKIAYLAFQVKYGHSHDRSALFNLLKEFDGTLSAFEHGGYSRDFYVYPAQAGIVPFLKKEQAEWLPYKSAALTIYHGPPGRPELKKALAYIEKHSDPLLAACDDLTAAFRETAEAATRRMNQLMLFLIGLDLLFGAGFFFYAQKNITAPLVQLDKAAAGITPGRYPKLDDPASGDEVANLFKTFTKMSRAINRDMERRTAISGLLAVSMESGSMAALLDKFLAYLLAIPWIGTEPKGAVLLVDNAGGSLKMAARRGLPEEVASQCAAVPFGRCICGKAAATGETQFVQGLDERHETAYEGMKPHGHYCIPIKVRGRVIGVLNLYVRAGHSYDESERDFLEAVCAIMAKAIEFKELEEESYQVQKMESLGKAAGAIAHDFNNILTITRGFNDLALESLPPGSEAARFVKETASGLEKGSTLVKHILDFSRKRPSAMAELDLNSVVTGMQPMLGLVLEKSVKLKLSLAAALPPLKANKGQLEQVLLNLAVNARDAMRPGGGEFSITTSVVPAGSAGSCGTELPGAAGTLRLSASDTGSGMPREVVEHVFEPFFTTKPEGQGTGLGLATVYSIVKLHNGAINITSGPGKGTTVDICLPAA